MAAEKTDQAHKPFPAGHYLFFNLPRTGTCVTTVGRTASGDTDFGGEVSFFGFFTILLVFC